MCGESPPVFVEDPATLPMLPKRAVARLGWLCILLQANSITMNLIWFEWEMEVSLSLRQGFEKFRGGEGGCSDFTYDNAGSRIGEHGRLMDGGPSEQSQ